MKRAAGIITDEGGMTSHAAIISRELGVPAVVGTGNGTRVLNDGQNVTLDGDKGTVRAGATADAESGEEFEPVEAARPDPRQADDGDGGEGERLDPGGGRARRGDRRRRSRPAPDRTHMVLSREDSREVYRRPRRPRVSGRTHRGRPAGRRRVLSPAGQGPDHRCPTDEFRELEGGEGEPTEPNPMLGWRGIRRSLDKPEPFRQELAAFARLYEMGYDNWR